MDHGRVAWVGLTGGIGTGKSSVSKLLTQMGFPVVDADNIVHQLLSEEGPVLSSIRNHFGDSFITDKGTVDRKLLGEYVFKSKVELEKLNAIVHPEVRKKTYQIRDQHFSEGKKIVFNDIPLLFEKGMESTYFATVVVYCSQEQQLERVKLRNKDLSGSQIQERMNAQINIELKRSMADFVIDNTVSLNSLKAAVEGFLSELKSSVST